MNITAIDWLKEELNKVLIENQIQQTEYFFKKAKEIEDHEIKYAYEEGYKDGYNRLAKIIEEFFTIQQTSK